MQRQLGARTFYQNLFKLLFKSLVTSVLNSSFPPLFTLYCLAPCQCNFALILQLKVNDPCCFQLCTALEPRQSESFVYFSTSKRPSHVYPLSPFNVDRLSIFGELCLILAPFDQSPCLRSVRFPY